MKHRLALPLILLIGCDPGDESLRGEFELPDAGVDIAMSSVAAQGATTGDWPATDSDGSATAGDGMATASGEDATDSGASQDSADASESSTPSDDLETPTPDQDTPDETETPTECTPAMMAELTGCETIAYYKHYRGAANSCDCQDDWCNWDECQADCTPRHEEELEECRDEHSLCAELYYASWAFCQNECLKQHASCVAAVYCRDEGGDVSHCLDEQVSCQRAC